MEKKENIILRKTFDFACSIVDLNDILIERKHFTIAKQVIRSGTSVGANVREAQRAVSKPDFINKMGIALKEADEKKYGLELIDAKIYKVSEKIKNDLEEIISILVSIINSTKKNSLALYNS